MLKITTNIIRHQSTVGNSNLPEPKPTLEKVFDRIRIKSREIIRKAVKRAERLFRIISIHNRSLNLF